MYILTRHFQKIWRDVKYSWIDFCQKKFLLFKHHWEFELSYFGVVVQWNSVVATWIQFSTINDLIMIVLHEFNLPTLSWVSLQVDCIHFPPTCKVGRACWVSSPFAVGRHLSDLHVVCDTHREWRVQHLILFSSAYADVWFCLGRSTHKLFILMLFI